LKTSKTKYDLVLLLAAMIWGFSFVAQRVATQYLGPFTFNGLRFVLGGLSVLPVLLFYARKKNELPKQKGHLIRSMLMGAAIGAILFVGSTLQQMGIADTTAGKSAFITGLYIIMVPIAGVFMKQTTGARVWICAITAVAGLYLLSVRGDFTVGKGELLVFMGSFMWAAHIIVIDRFSKKVDVIYLSFFQFVSSALYSLLAAVLFETIRLESIMQVTVPLLYSGIFSTGVAFTLQAVGQKHAKPSHAALILSLEAAFASIAGFLLLNEQLNLRESLGCVLMFAGMIISQLPARKKQTLMQ
jgi:drug/metabolite transporter (DMT)-like permease